MDGLFVKDRRVTAIWNYSVTMRLFYSSFEICKHCALLAFVRSVNLMCVIINQWVKREDSKLSLKNLIFIKYQMMAPLDLNKALTGILAINRYVQQIRFCNVVVSKTSNIAR